MGKKSKIPGLASEQRTEVNELRREPARPAGLYLLELRHHAGKNSLPRRKLIVSIEGGEHDDSAPKPVKITFT